MAVHGGNTEEIARKYKLNPSEIIDFSANINPLGISENVKKAMIDAIDKVVKYPDITYFDLKNSISNFEDINSQNIILGNGAAEAIFNIVRALKPKKALLPAPTFSEYEEAILSVNGEIKYYKLKEKNNFEIDNEFIDNIKDDIDVVFICNPNNPTGNTVYLASILEMMAEQEKLLIVDETFMEFVPAEGEYSLVSKVKDYKNLIIIKAVTKFFGLPGLRLGYGVSSNRELLEGMYEYKEPWTVNSFAETLTPTLFQDVAYIKESKAYFDLERKRMMTSLKEIRGLKVYETDTNFILLKLETLKAYDLKKILFEKYDLLIRDASNFKGLDAHFIRIAVKSEEENNKLITALRKEIDHELY